MRRRLQSARGVLVVRIERRQQRRGDRDEHQHDRQNEAAGEGEVAQKLFHSSLILGSTTP